MRAHTQLPPEGPTSNTITLWGRVLTREPEARGHRHSAFKIIWAPLSLLNFHAAFRTCLSISSKNHSLLMMIFFSNLQINLERIHIKKMWSLFVNENYIFFHLFRSFISFCMVLSFSTEMSCIILQDILQCDIWISCCYEKGIFLFQV